MSSRAPWIALCSFGLVHCADPLEAPSAFSDERFLCDDSSRPEFDSQVARCRAARTRDPSACSGVFSLRGVVDSEPVVIDSLISRAFYQNKQLQGIADFQMVVVARSPYFSVNLDMISNDRTPPTSAALIASSYLNLEARGGNYLSSLKNETYDLQVLTSSEARVWLSADLGRGGFIEGCFHAFLPSSKVSTP